MVLRITVLPLVVKFLPGASGSSGKFSPLELLQLRTPATPSSHAPVPTYSAE